MSRPLRLPASLAALALLLPALVACGGSDSDEATDSPVASGEGLSEVTFTGEVGESLSAEWSAEVEKPSETEVVTLVEGDGEEIEDGDVVTTYLFVANGTSQEQVYNDYDNGTPQQLPNSDPAPQVFLDLMDGATYGSRVAAITTAAEIFDGQVEGNALGLGEDDAVVLVADLVDRKSVV